jgi:DNA invertase Pin-like site-specific DNA recombinase
VPNYVAYFRVSTVRQGESGLGLEAQRQAVARYLQPHQPLIAEFVEVESGRRATRPQLQAALALCKRGSAILIVAKLDRLARDAYFILGLSKAGIEFLCCDNPNVNRLTIGILALVAEEEARAISTRTKEALAAARARGVRLGENGKALAAANRARAEWFAENLRDRLQTMQCRGLSVRRMVAALNGEGVATPSGTGAWHVGTLQRVLATLRRAQAVGDRLRLADSL